MKSCQCSRGDNFCNYHKRLSDVYESFIKSRKLKYKGTGSSRRAFASKRFVYKFPCNSAGIVDNKIEAILYKKRQHVTCDRVKIGKYLAKCVLLKNNILRMEKLKIRHNGNLNFETDGNQGGYNKNGKWKLYDYSLCVNYKGRAINIGWGPGAKVPKFLRK